MIHAQFGETPKLCFIGPISEAHDVLGGMEPEESFSASLISKYNDKIEVTRRDAPRAQNILRICENIQSTKRSLVLLNDPPDNLLILHRQLAEPPRPTLTI